MQSLNSGWAVAAAREWHSLERESDPQLYWEGVFAFAARQENHGRLDLAATAYQKILSEAPASLPLREAAVRRLDAFQGRGEAGPRAELLLRQFVEQATEPTALLAMALAGATYQMARAATLSRLAASPTTNFLTRGFGARVTASLTGFAVEAPTFTLAGKLGNEALGRSQDWKAPVLGRELASSYLVLGGLKLTGWASQSLHTRLGAGEALGGLFHQGGMLSGILLGHRLEEWTGLRRRQEGATTLIDSLAMLLQFHVSGKLLPNVLGRDFPLRERLLQDAVRGEGPRSTRGKFPPAFGDRLLLSVAKGPLAPGASSNWDVTNLKVQSQGVHFGNGSRRFEENGWTRFDFEGASVNEIISLLSEHLENPEAASRTRVALPENFTELVLEWGYDFQERTRRDFGEQFTLISQWSEKLSAGQALQAEEIGALETLQSQLQARLSIYNLAQGTLRSAVGLSRDTDPANRGRQEGNRRVLHDLYYRSEFLTGVDYCLSGLLEGSPLDPDLLSLLQNPRGNNAGSALKDGINLASSSFPGVAQILGNSWYQGFHNELEFTEGRRATRALADVMANLLTNVWRYRSSETPVAEFSANPTPDGGLKISLRDDGIGILPEHLFDLGGNGYREARKEVKGSQGFGLASVIENLRALGWGPLWVRSAPGSRTEFRFEIPAQAFVKVETESKTVNPPDVMGQGPENLMEAWLREGFLVPRASLNLAIRDLMSRVPAGPVTYGEWAPEMASGKLRHRRLEILHRLLAAGRSPAGIHAIDNGPGALIEVAATLAGQGSSVMVKEPGPEVSTHHRLLRKYFPAELQGRIRYARPEDLDAETRADIVYWTNPSTFYLGKPTSGRDGDYFGRDVSPGGFLVLQTDHHFGSQKSFRRLEMNPEFWEMVFDEELPNLQGAENYVLPTSQGLNLHLQIYRRRG